MKHIAAVIPSNIDKHSRDDEVSVSLCNYTDVYYNDVITGDLDLLRATATRSQVALLNLRAGDTIVTKDSETADDIAVPAYVPKTLPGVVCGYHLSIVRPTSAIDGRFLSRVFESRYLRARLETLARGLTRVGLGLHALSNVTVPVPPLGEQRQITAFLDHETSRIDALVQEQERLIEILEEKRLGEIFYGVSRGLGDTREMHDSQEWLSEIPSNWTMTRLKRIARLITGITPQDHEESIGQEGLLPWIRPDDFDVRRGTVHPSRFLTRPPQGRVRVVPAGSSLVSCIGTVGSTVYTRQAASTNQQITSVVPDRHSRFLFFVLTAAKQEMKRRAVGNVLSILNSERLGELAVPVPPEVEADAIARHLESIQTSIDEMMCTARRQIQLLKERRSALISSAVTGALDVRRCGTVESIEAAS